METVNTIYTGGLRTKSTHVKSGVTLVTDAPVDNFGKGEYFSPTDLLAASLGSCMLTVMGIAADKNGFSIDNTSMKITKLMVANPRRVSELIVDVEMRGNFTDEQKKIVENAGRNCPVALSLHPDVFQNITFSYGG